MKKSLLDERQPAAALVYDIVNCGPRNRFVANGKLVHNSGSDRINIQNLPRKGALRASILAPPGYVLVVSDLSAIEARMLAWLAGEEALVSTFRDGGDVYSVFASRLYGRTITKGKDPGPRSLAKTMILGLGYGLGWRQFAKVLAAGPMGQPPILFGVGDLETLGIAMDPDIDTEGTTTKLSGENLLAHCSIAKYLVETYRGTYTAIPKYWKTGKQVISAMARGVKHQFGPVSTGEKCLYLPSSMRLQYRDLRKGEQSWEYSGKRGKTQRLYGAKLVENIDQALSRIVLTDAATAIGERYKVAFTVHDEVVVLVPEDGAEEGAAFVTECMSRSPAWCKDLPLACETTTVTSYGEA